MSNNSNTNGNSSLPDEKPFNTNISLNQTESTLNHDTLPTSNGASTASNLGTANALDAAGALTNDFNRANNSTLISLAARINSGFNSFYPGLHSDTYG